MEQTLEITETDVVDTDEATGVEFQIDVTSEAKKNGLGNVTKHRFFAVADGGAGGRKAAMFDSNPHGGSEDYAFVYLNVRMGKGRSEATQQHAGEMLVEVTKKHFADLFVKRHIGITLQIDVGPEVFDHKHSNVHPLFAAL